jgi:dTDP-4-amino-4,6-dideoxygalactose transaminase
LTVTVPLQPDPDALFEALRSILGRGWLTNGGLAHEALEAQLAASLGVSSVSLTTNGTLAIELAIRALVPEGEVITPGFSFPATWSYLVDHDRYRPVFVDVDDDLNVDPGAVEAAVTPRTRAILAVHTYGWPCDHARLRSIADRHGLAIIYDAAHAFGVRLRGEPIAAWGDASTYSLHATKVWGTVEGGAVAASSTEVHRRVRSLRNFGFEVGGGIQTVGTNAKLDELRAAYGLTTLPLVERALAARAAVVRTYLTQIQRLRDRTWLDVQRWRWESPSVEPNNAYFPVRIRPVQGVSRDRVLRTLRDRGVLARPYFSATAATEPAFARYLPASGLPMTLAASNEMLCLPLHHEMTPDDVTRVVEALAAVEGAR